MAEDKKISDDIEVRTSQALELIKGSEDGALELDKLLKLVAPEPKPVKAPDTAPLPRVITEDQQAALARLEKVFGAINPTEPRELEPSEIPMLIEERMTLDTVKKMTEARLADITVIAHNHLDAEAEESGEAKKAERDNKGHYVLPGVVADIKAGKGLRREVREGAPTLTEAGLRALDEAGELDHEDYLAMTTQTRYVDEAKVTLLLRKKPELVKVIRPAITPPTKSTAVYLRKV